MAKVEPATYRIVNVGHKTAITVPAENNNTVVTWEISNQSGQQVGNVWTDSYVPYSLKISGSYGALGEIIIFQMCMDDTSQWIVQRPIQ